MDFAGKLPVCARKIGLYNVFLQYQTVNLVIMETMELAAYIFFISLFAVSIAVGIWLEKGKYRGKV